MTLVSNDPIWWPTINSNNFYSYSIAASAAVVMYDWALAFGQEVELVWRQRWSVMTALYLSVRYLGILYAGINMLNGLPLFSLTDIVGVSFSTSLLVRCNNRNSCNILFYITGSTAVVTSTMLGIIMIARLHAMYLRSRKILIFLVIIFLAISIPCTVMIGINMHYVSGEELVLSGTYQCTYGGNDRSLSAICWILSIVWQVLALCLALHITMKHFCELRRLGPSTGLTVGNCFAVLLQTHVLYFTSFAAAACLSLSVLSPNISHSIAMESQIRRGIPGIESVVQLFVLGPRLILSVREYHAKLVSDSDAGTSLATIAFQERIHVSTGNGV